MKILQIELSADEQQFIYDGLIKRFNTEDAIQKVNFGLGAEIEGESLLELYTEYPEPDENNQTAISSRSVVKFRITFFHDGEEVQVKDWDIEDRIKKYYEI